MAKSAVNLPEKDYFTVTEVAKRWACEPDTVYHYIHEQEILRFGVQTKHIPLKILCLDDSDLDLMNLSKLVEFVLPHFFALQKTMIDLNYMQIHDNIDQYLEDLNFNKFADKAIHRDEMPQFLYPESEFLNWYEGSIAPYSEDNERGYFLTLTDINGSRFLLIDPLQRLVAPAFQSFFKIIPKEERDRFEMESGILIDDDIPMNSNEELISPLINSKQNSRELVLRGWLKGANFNPSDTVPMKQSDLWDLLTGIAPELFQPASTETVKEFFKKQQHCKFRVGRPKEG